MSRKDIRLHYKYDEFAKVLCTAQAKSNALYANFEDPFKISAFSRKTAKRYTLYQYMENYLRNYVNTINEPLNTAEFGIYQGVTSLMFELFFSQTNGSIHHAFDSFEGLSKPQQVDNRPEVEGIMSPDFEKSQKLLSNSILYKGWIPQELPTKFEAKLDFVHIDLDLYEPIKGALEFILPKMKSGSIIIVDDYGTNFLGAMHATNEHIKSNRERYAHIMNHFTGQIALTVR